MVKTESMEEAIRKKKKERGYAFIPYLAMDDPDMDKTLEIADLYIKRGAASIELGLPFTDPVADGVILQRAFRRILKKPFKISRVLTTLRKLSAAHPGFPFIVMGYANIFYQYGMEKISLDMERAGVRALVVPDLPFEEKLRNPQIADSSIPWVNFITLSSSPERIRTVVEKSHGFIYLVSVKGITGTTEPDFREVEPLARQIKAVKDIPVIIGFGIKSKKQIAEILRFSDGFIIGSRFHEIIEKIPDKDILPALSRELDLILL